jgi:putative transposase
MARIARVVVPGVPHHVTQRGNRRQQVFFCEDDYQSYLELMSEWCRKRGVKIWAYCLIPNHVHLIAVPKTEISLARAIGEAHRRYTRMINFRENWRGYLWQGRFASFPLDEKYLVAAVRYIELNPVRAGLAKEATDYRWSSARAHIEGADDMLVKSAPLLKIVGEDWSRFLSEEVEEKEIAALRRHERTGRPLGGEKFIKRLEKKLGRVLKREKPGPKRRN